MSITSTSARKGASPAREMMKPTSLPPIPVRDTAPSTMPAEAQATHTNGMPRAPLSTASMTSRTFMPGLNLEATSRKAPIRTKSRLALTFATSSGRRARSAARAAEIAAATQAERFSEGVLSGLKLKNATNQASPMPIRAALMGV